MTNEVQNIPNKTFDQMTIAELRTFMLEDAKGGLDLCDEDSCENFGDWFACLVEAVREECCKWKPREFPKSSQAFTETIEAFMDNGVKEEVAERLLDALDLSGETPE